MLYLACICFGVLSTALSFELKDDITTTTNLTSATMTTNRLLTRMTLTHDEEIACQKYSNRTYVPTEQQKHPTVLWTFPGSGSGWVRLLIEHATGHYSGSVYGDESLLAEMPGDYECSRRVPIIKAHPTTHDYSVLKSGRYNPSICKTIHHFDKAIMVIRNPYDAIWSDHNRKITRSHVGKIKKNQFNRKTWVLNAQRLAHKYNAMWTHSYDPFIRAKNTKQHLIIKYEDMINPELQLNILGNILQLLEYEYTTEKLKCAFYLANHPKVKRPKVSEDAVKKTDAYNKQLVCQLWKILETPAKRGDYKRFAEGEYNC